MSARPRWIARVLDAQPCSNCFAQLDVRAVTGLSFQLQPDASGRGRKLLPIVFLRCPECDHRQAKHAGEVPRARLKAGLSWLMSQTGQLPQFGSSSKKSAKPKEPRVRPSIRSCCPEEPIGPYALASLRRRLRCYSFNRRSPSFPRLMLLFGHDVTQEESG